MLVIEQFLNDKYRIRRNILNGKVEFATLPEAGPSADGLSRGFSEADLVYRPLTPEAINSIVIRAKKEQILEKGNPKTEITERVTSILKLGELSGMEQRMTNQLNGTDRTT